MRHLFIFGLTFLLIGGCTTNHPRFESGFSKRPPGEKNELKFPSMKGNATSRQAQKENFRDPSILMAKKNYSGRGKPRPFTYYSPNEKFLLPTITNAKDGSLMALVNSGANRVSQLDVPRGTIQADRTASGSLNLPRFYMDLLEVTVDQYKKFDGKYDEKPFTEGKECPDCPAMGIDWVSAVRYCHWAGKRLPTETEWVAAAGGRDLWPWGNQFSPEKANLWGNQDGSFLAAPVGSYSQGASPHGLLDMTGNVWEWVSTPHLPSNRESETTTLRIVKGGGWTSNKLVSRISFKNIVHPAMKNPTIGFRCAKSIKKNNQRKVGKRDKP